MLCYSLSKLKLIPDELSICFRPNLRMSGLLLEDLWTGTGRVVILLLCSARLAFVDANGGAILPSLNKVGTNPG